jgi:hypothetical protein
LADFADFAPQKAYLRAVRSQKAHFEGRKTQKSGPNRRFSGFLDAFFVFFDGFWVRKKAKTCKNKQ